MVSIKSMLPKKTSRKSSSASSSPREQSPRAPSRRKGKALALEVSQSEVVIDVKDEEKRSEGMMMEEVRSAFERFDVNGDGKVSAEEVRGVMTMLMGGKEEVVTEEEAKMMVEEADGDGDGLIDLHDFVRLFFSSSQETLPSASTSNSSSKDELQNELAAAFDIFDLDGNGSISAEELHTIMCRLMGDQASTLQDCERIICRVDTKGSGRVDFNDFLNMMTTAAT